MGRGRWRIVLPNAGDRGRQPPSFEEIQDLVAQRAPQRIVVSDPGWMTCFGCQLRSTTAYRRGRALLAGDAAHIHSPAGGQGMNTGMMDANNLAWKLAMVNSGAADSLLDSYGQERLPVASNVLGFTDKIVGWSLMRNPVKRAVRDTLIPAVTSLPAVQKRAASRLSQVSVAYSSSPLIRPDGIRRGPRPGERVPDVEVGVPTGRTRLYEVLGGGRHVLLASNVEIKADLKSSGLDHFRGLVDIVDGDLRAVHRAPTDRPAAFALVRPDGVLAARGSRGETHKVIDYFQQVCGRGATESADPQDSVATAAAVVGNSLDR
jgi:hypothetical protein